MPFHMCPFEPRAQNIFKNNPQGLLKKRIPISARAERIRTLLHSYDPKEIKIIENDHLIRTNRVNILNSSPNSTKEQLAAVFGNIIPLFSGSYIYLWIEEDAEHFPIFTLKAFSFKGKEGIPDISSTKNALVRMEFRILEEFDEVFLENLRSWEKGYAGITQTALYNATRALGISKICTFTTPSNLNVQQFSFRMDFGRPTDELGFHWKVNVL